MNIQDHVKFSIDAHKRQEEEHALLHACLAVDGTTKKFYKLERSNAEKYKECLRDYYWLLGPFIGGLDPSTIFSHIHLQKQNGTKIDNPDVADVIYHVFRCCSAHASEIPLNFKLVKVDKGICSWHFGEDRLLHIPERVIFALLAVSVFSKANKDIKSTGDYTLYYEHQDFTRVTHFPINKNWGNESDVKTFLKSYAPKLIKHKDLSKFKSNLDDK